MEVYLRSNTSQSPWIQTHIQSHFNFTIAEEPSGYKVE